MNAPQRIQRKRSKGWRLPEGAVCVSRPGPWGNPFAVRPIRSRDGSRRWQIEEALWGFMTFSWKDKADAARYAVETYRARILAETCIAVPSVDRIREHLAGRDLACWCALDQPCHADVLLEIANSSSGAESKAAGHPSPSAAASSDASAPTSQGEEK